MASVKVKICGITNAIDANAAVQAGADALGFIFYEDSPRYIRPDLAAEIISGLPPFVSTVGVFVNASIDMTNEVCWSTGIHIAQLHGDESPNFCRELRTPIIKAIRVRDKSWVSNAEKYSVKAILLDSFSKKQYGGTGKTFDWNVVKNSSHRIILSGGLNPENVAEAIKTVQPYGGDVGSGLEQNLGHKDHFKIQAFVKAVKNLS